MKNLLYLFFLLFSISCWSQNNETNVIYLSDFLTDNQALDDATPAIRAAVSKCIETKAKKLILPGGKLNLKHHKALEKYQFISNNDPGLKRIAFDLVNMNNFTIEGNQTTLMFTGFISPFNLENSSNITIRNLSIDYTRTFHSEGEIVDKGSGWLEIKFPEDYISEISNDCLYFRDNNYIYYPFSSLLEFDKIKHEPAYMAKDYWLSKQTINAEKKENGNIRIKREDLTGTVGNILVFGAAARYHPAFTLDNCNGVNFYNMNIFHCGGMGIIAQKSRDIELNKVNVITSPSSGRIISTTADATHFVNCGGYIRMIDCVFENQKDDATNIHGWYMAVDEIIDENTLLLRWKNTGQFGINFIKSNDKLEFVDNETMVTYAYAKVKHVEQLNKEYSKVIFEEPLPREIKKNHVVAADDYYPDILIRGCRIQKNRARGMLIGSRGKVVIRNNYFHTAGAAILFEGDGNFWYEQSGVKDVLIIDNIFENCNYGYSNWGRACIAVGSGIPDRKGGYYHHNIRIVDNKFRIFDPRILYLHNVDGCIFSGNKIEKTTDYTYTLSETRNFVYDDCININIEE
jgi:hypothetical protein